MMLHNITFAAPAFFYLFILVAGLIAWYVWRSFDRRHTVRLSSFTLLDSLPTRRTNWWAHLLYALRMLALSLLIVALARPQSFERETSSTTEGIDIVLSLDVSGSMLARDFQPDRIEAAKKIGIQFVSGRPTDRMGLVIFAAEAFTMCPLTVDHATLINQFNQVRTGVLADGTAIGSGLAMAVARLEHSDAVSRVVILLTDGVNNSGEVAPYTAAEIAKAYGVRVYVIGVGSQGTAPYPIQTPFGVQYQEMEVQIDEEQMQQIAQLTGGDYFRATDNKALEQVYARIDQLEKSKIHVDRMLHMQEEFFPWGLAALVLLVVEQLLRRILLRTLP